MAAEAHLFCLAIGPVQSFIDAARRMRDLHQGSRVLADLARGLAQALQDHHGADLIFPAPGAGPSQETGDTTNKLLCLLPAHSHPADVADAMRTSLHRQLADMGEACLAELERSRLLDAVNVAEFRHQIGDTLQTHAAWCVLVGGSAASAHDYAQAYDRVIGALEARKLTRSFEPNIDAPPGVALSSLDGRHESVLADAAHGAGDDARQLAGRLRLRLGLTPAEHLDAIGLLKRTLGRVAAFPAVSRVALQPWVASMPTNHREALHQRLDRLTAWDHLSRRNGCQGADDPMTVLPFDCEVLLPGRLAVLRSQSTADEVTDPQPIEALDDLRTWLALRDEHGLPQVDLPRDDTPHIALLLADGDRMGALLTDLARLQGMAGHRALAGALRTAASAAHVIVRRHGGRTLYAGGDDVMAMLPVDTALACADALRSDVEQRLSGVLPEELRPRATLSVGVAIGHVLMPMGRLRQQARNALQQAKNGPPMNGVVTGLRNALCVWVEPRNGRGRACCGAWADNQTPHALAHRLQLWQRVFDSGEASRSLPYDLITEATDEAPWVLGAAVKRLLQRRLQAAPTLIEELTRCVETAWSFWSERAPGPTNGRWVADRLADELYVARWLQAHPRPVTANAAGKEVAHA